MAEELVPISADEYRRKTRRVVRLTSGNVFSIRGLNARSAVALIGVIPKEGITGDNLRKFVEDNFDFLLGRCILPSVLEPILDVEDYMLVDVVELLAEIMEMMGMGPEEAGERDKFRPEPDVGVP